MTRSFLAPTEIQRKMTGLKAALDFLEASRERNDSTVLTRRVTPEDVIRKGIWDLDFDGYYFLGTGETSKEEWALKKP